MEVLLIIWLVFGFASMVVMQKTRVEMAVADLPSASC